MRLNYNRLINNMSQLNWKKVKAITISLPVLIVVILGEGWIVSFTYMYGFLISFIFFCILGILINEIVIYLFYFGELNRSKIVIIINNWIKSKKEKHKDTKLVTISAYLLLFINNIIIGPLTTTIIVLIAKDKSIVIHIYSIILNIIFFLFWVGIYSGLVNIII